MSSQLPVSVLERPSPASRLFGYARVSTDDQDLSLQIDALQQHGIQETNIFRDRVPGAKTVEGRNAVSVCLAWHERAPTYSLPLRSRDIYLGPSEWSGPSSGVQGGAGPRRPRMGRSCLSLPVLPFATFQNLAQAANGAQLPHLDRIGSDI